jgi:outer membrane protein
MGTARGHDSAARCLNQNIDLGMIQESEKPALALLSPIAKAGSSHCVIVLFILLLFANHIFAQSAPASSDRPWHSPQEQDIEREASNFHRFEFGIDPIKIYSLPELIDFAEAHNPQTRDAWERARAQAAALGVARSELYPTLVSIALSQIDRIEVLLQDKFFRQTVQTFAVAFELNYTIFDFGARAGRISAARAEVLAANFAFNDTHRRVIYQVEQAYYQLLNAVGQENAARADLANAQAVQQSAEDRLRNGLATLPDVLEARSATAQAQYDLQAALGAEDTAQGNLATALGISPAILIHVQPLEQVPTPQSIEDNVDQEIDRALTQRPDLLQQVAEIRSANARVKEANSAYYPSLDIKVRPSLESLYGLQQQYDWAHTADLLGGLNLSLNWTIFDGGERKNRLAQAKASVRAAEAQASITRDRIANEVWTAYSNLKTALRQQEAAKALLESASQSYAASLESYNYGVRSLLDVTAAQRVLAQARSSDISARTQVLTSLANLAFQAGDSIQAAPRRPQP